MRTLFSMLQNTGMTQTSLFISATIEAMHVKTRVFGTILNTGMMRTLYSMKLPIKMMLTSLFTTQNTEVMPVGKSENESNIISISFSLQFVLAYS